WQCISSSALCLTVSMAVRQDERHEATTQSPNSSCRHLSRSNCRMRDGPELRFGRARRAMDQFVGHALDDQSRWNVSRCSYKAKGTDLGHLYALWRYHHGAGDSQERIDPYKLQRPVWL